MAHGNPMATCRDFMLEEESQITCMMQRIRLFQAWALAILSLLGVNAPSVTLLWKLQFG